MKCLSILALIVAAHLSSFAQFKNIKLAEQVDGVYPPVEPSIAINKKNPKNILAGVVLDRAIYTQDGGATWSETKLESPYGVFGDPAVVSDSKGDFYFFHLADPSKQGRSSDEWLDRIVCQKSRNPKMEERPGAKALPLETTLPKIRTKNGRLCIRVSNICTQRGPSLTSMD